MSIKAAFILPGCSHSQGGHPPPPVMPDPDRASRAKSPFSAIADNPFHVILGLGPRIQDKESLFWRGVNVNKSGINAAWMLAFASMTGEGYPRIRKEDGR